MPDIDLPTANPTHLKRAVALKMSPSTVDKYLIA